MIKIERLPKGIHTLALLSSLVLLPVCAHGSTNEVRALSAKETVDTDKVYVVAEVMPEFIGGNEKMLEFINENLQYPENVADYGYGSSFRVIVQFVVGRDGSVSKAKVIRGKDSVLDAEALRVVGMFPKFKPGSMDGKAVKVYFTLPIVFKFPDAPEEPTEMTGCGTAEFVEAMAGIWHYPEKAIKKSLTGTVYVIFDVDSDGTFNVAYTKAFPDPRKSGAPGVQKKDIQMLIDEAVRSVGKAVEQVGATKINGEPFPSRFLLPVRFQISGKPYVKADYTPMAPMTILEEVVVMAEAD